MHTALLIIDVQRGLFDSTPRPDAADSVIAHINALSAQARAAGAPVVFIQHERADSPLAHGSEAWQLDRQLVVAAGDTKLRKTTPDAFLRTDLAELLTGWGCSQVVICGYATEFCIDSTTRRAAALGYAVVLAADAHTTHDKDHASAAQIRAHHNITLPNLTSFGPRIEAKPSREVRFGA